MRHLFTLTAAFLSTGCGQALEPHDALEWRSLSQVFVPIRAVKFLPSVSSESCLFRGMSTIIGNADGATLNQLVVIARERHPEAAILSVRASGRYAEVQTLWCRGDGDPKHAEGYSLLFRNDDGRWLFKEQQQWLP